MTTTQEEQQTRLRFLSQQLEEVRTNLLDSSSSGDLESVSAIALQAEYNSLHNDMAAISLLPVEILSLIFETGHASSDVRDRFELLVSHVTRRWRSIAIGTPMLWTNITRGQGQMHFDLQAVYLARSKATHIHLTLYIESEQRVGALYLSSLCHLIRPYLGRLRQLTVSADSRKGLVELLNCFSSASAPFLKSITIIWSGFGFGIRQAGNDTRRIFSGGAPSLASFQLVNIHPASCLPPTDSMASLKLVLTRRDDRLSLFSLRDHLNGMRSLAYLELEGLVGAFTIPFPAGFTIEMPYLHSLSIDSMTTRSALQISHFLLAVQAPGLHALRLIFGAIYEYDVGDFDESLVIGGASRFPMLRELYVNCYRCDLRRIARAFPSIVTLHWHCLNPLVDITSFLQELDPDSQPRAPWWPNIYSLAMDG